MSEENRMGHLDFIRGVAILGVLVVHAKIFLVDPVSSLFYGIASEGARGVQLFYILSAFTLFMSLARSGYVGTKAQTIKYFIRRIFRIVPMFYVAILVYILWLHPTFGAIISTVTFAANFIPQHMEGLVVGQWSVIIEMFFYLLVPLLFLKIKDLKMAERYFKISLVFASAFLLSIVLAMHSIYPNAPIESWYFYVFFSLPVQLPHFMLGFFTYFLLRDLDNKKLWRPLARIFAWTLSGEIIFIAAVLALTHQRVSNMISPIIYLESAFLVLFFVIISRSYRYISKLKWFSNTIEHLGRVSFSMYLTHWIILTAITHNRYYEIFARETNGYVEFFFLITVGTAVIAAVSTVTHSLIEKSGQRLGSKISLSLLNPQNPVGHPESLTVESRG